MPKIRGARERVHQPLYDTVLVWPTSRRIIARALARR